MNKLKTIKKIITTIQQERLKKTLEQILILIYRFRFLTRPQIQILLNHKNHAKAKFEKQVNNKISLFLTTRNTIQFAKNDTEIWQGVE